jgi:hypothetical protein
MSHLVDIFLQPGKAFAELKERPGFLLPAVLTVLFTGLIGFLYFQNVDGSWYIDHMLSANPDLTAKEIAQQKAAMPGTTVMGYITLAAMLIGIPFVLLLMSVYYLLAGKVTGNDVSFRHALSLSAWPMMPTLLGMLPALYGVLTMDPQTPMESLYALNLDPLLVELPMDNRWSGLAKGFSLLSPWAWFLSALGWKTWGRTGWGQAIVVVMLPTVVIYGGMIAWALMK